MSLKKYEILIVNSWDIQKVSQLIMEGVPFEDLIFDKTDILLEAILRNEFILFKRILSRGFPIKNSKFNHLTPILNNYNENKKKYVDVLFNYVSPKDYINRKSGINKENALSIVTQQQHQNIIIELSQMGGDWNSTNNLNQTPFHFLLRNHFFMTRELVDEIKDKNININKKDDFDITACDIINNLLLLEDWKTEENINLLKVIGYENWK